MSQTMKPLTFHTTIFLLIFSFSLTSSLNSDGLSLLALKSAITSDPTNALESWSPSDPTPCNWMSVICALDRVTTLSLSNKSLTGYIPSELGALLSLRHLSLSRNNFFGPIPAQITNLKSLISLDLSSNSLNGSLPVGLSELTQLNGTLNLSYNSFSGEVPSSYGSFPVSLSLDLRHNNLTGKIPQVGSLLNQGPTAFDGNPRLCGFPLSNPCPMTESLDDKLHLHPKKENPKSIDDNPDGVVREERVSRTGMRLKSIPLISGLFAIVGGVLFVFLWVSRRKKGFKEGKMGKGGKMGVVVRKGEGEGEGQNGKFVVVYEEGFRLEMEDLLRASAYVVGKGRSGIVYKVVVVGRGGGKGSGVVAPILVSVRRLSEGDDVMWRFKEFEAEVESIGRVHHPNILPLRAYYYAHDEKLLVSDFIPNGSLYTALHGGPSNDLQPLSWASRLKIAQGIARGLLYIHECSPKKYVHGNFKSSKILLDEDFHPYISGFGLNRLVRGPSKSVNPSSNRSNLNQNHLLLMGSKMLAPPFVPRWAPEVRSGGKLTQKCDVYSFGIVLMEILTGRLPYVGPDNGGIGLESLVRKVFCDERPLSEIIDPALLHEVYAKKQVLTMFHIALNCTELDPELRPRMRSVSESLDCLEFQ